MTTDSVYTLNDGGNASEIERLNFNYRTFGVDITGKLLPEVIKNHLLSLKRPPAVADIATGTGIFLQDLAETLPRDSRLDGFDFDTSKFMEASQLPSNVKLMFGNAFKDFPDELHGQYDCVHVRLLVYALKADQWDLVVGNLKKLLRPGGWIFWDDIGYPSWTCLPMIDSFAKWLKIETRYAISVGRDVT